MSCFNFVLQSAPELCFPNTFENWTIIPVLCFANIWHTNFILNEKDEEGIQLRFHLPIKSLTYYYLSLCKNFREMIPALGIVRLLVIIFISKFVLWTLPTFNFIHSSFRRSSPISYTLTCRMTVSLESENCQLLSPKQKGIKGGVFTDPHGWFLEVLQ